MWKYSIRNIVVIFQPNILRVVGFYVRHSARDNLWLSTHIRCLQAYRMHIFVLLYNISPIRSTQYKKEFLYLKCNFLYLEIESDYCIFSSLIHYTWSRNTFYSVCRYNFLCAAMGFFQNHMQRVFMNMYVLGFPAGPFRPGRSREGPGTGRDRTGPRDLEGPVVPWSQDQRSPKAPGLFLKVPGLPGPFL